MCVRTDTRATAMQIEAMRDLTATARGRRKDLGLSQAELARRAGVSREWINAFEAGKPTAEIGLVLRLLQALGLDVHLEIASVHDGAPRGNATNLDTLIREYRD